MKMREDVSNAQLSTPLLIFKLCGGAGFLKEEKAIPHFPKCPDHLVIRTLLLRFLVTENMLSAVPSTV